MTTPYTTGTITLTSGSAVITGTGTGWQTALIVGGMVAPDADGNALPILSVDSNTQITAAVKWRGASGTYAYAIMRDTAYGQQTVANAQALSTYLQRLDNASLSALASLAASMSADKFAYATGLNTMAWATLSTLCREMLALGDVAAVRNKIGAYSAGGGPIGGHVNVTGNVAATGTVEGYHLFSKTPVGLGGNFSFYSGGLTRWVIEKQGVGETGGNAGADLVMTRWGDAGEYLGTPFAIKRNSGIVSLNETPFMQCNLGGDFTATAGQAYGIANGGFDFQRGGFGIGGSVGGRNAVHLPVAGRYRITMSMAGVGIGGISMAEVLINGSSVFSQLAMGTSYAQNSNTCVIAVAAGAYLTWRPGNWNLSVTGWNSRFVCEFISFN